jgi:hypothetical protein
MGLDDFLEPEVAVVVAVTAAIASPPVRKAMRRGAVYGLAGLLVAKDKLTSLTGGIAQGAQQAVTAARETAARTRTRTRATPAAG